MIKKKDFKKGTHCIIGIGRLPMHLYRCQIVSKLDDNMCCVYVEPYQSTYKNDLAVLQNDGYYIVSRYSTCLCLDDGSLDCAYDNDNPLCQYLGIIWKVKLLD